MFIELPCAVEFGWFDRKRGSSNKDPYNYETKTHLRTLMTQAADRFQSVTGYSQPAAKKQPQQAGQELCL